MQKPAILVVVILVLLFSVSVAGASSTIFDGTVAPQGSAVVSIPGGELLGFEVQGMSDPMTVGVDCGNGEEFVVPVDGMYEVQFGTGGNCPLENSGSSPVDVAITMASGEVAVVTVAPHMSTCLLPNSFGWQQQHLGAGLSAWENQSNVEVTEQGVVVHMDLDGGWQANVQQITLGGSHLAWFNVLANGSCEWANELGERSASLNW